MGFQFQPEAFILGIVVSLLMVTIFMLNKLLGGK